MENQAPCPDCGQVHTGPHRSKLDGDSEELLHVFTTVMEQLSLVRRYSLETGLVTAGRLVSVLFSHLPLHSEDKRRELMASWWQAVQTDQQSKQAAATANVMQVMGPDHYRNAADRLEQLEGFGVTAAPIPAEQVH
jgi:hypothetical protein